MVTVLLVEDSPTQAMHIQLLLEQCEYQVILAENGIEALAALKDHDPDLVVSDLEMPELGGLGLIERMQMDFPGIPAILITALGSEDLAVEALRQGAAAYVPKSRLEGLLEQTISNVLGVMRTDRSFAQLIGCMLKNDYEFELPNDACLVSPVANFIIQVTSGMDLFPSMENVRLAIAIEQALNNAMFRGNLELSNEEYSPAEDNEFDGVDPEIVVERRSREPFASRKVRLTACVSRAGVEIKVRDQGNGFDTSIVPSSKHESTIDIERSRGLLMMVTHMDEVRFNERGNEVTMLKHARAKKLS
jgi:CheY-like chemotaxis protein